MHSPSHILSAYLHRNDKNSHIDISTHKVRAFINFGLLVINKRAWSRNGWGKVLYRKREEHFMKFRFYFFKAMTQKDNLTYSKRLIFNLKITTFY